MKPVKVVSDYLKALLEGDISKAFSYFDKNVEWHQPGNNRFSGIKKGTDEVYKMIENMMEVSKGTFVLKPHGDIMVNDMLISVPLYFSGNVGERSINMFGIDLFKVQNGRIVEVWLFSENQSVEDDFWGI